MLQEVVPMYRKLKAGASWCVEGGGTFVGITEESKEQFGAEGGTYV